MNKNCYIWTRVSTKHQEDNGGSLAYQKELCTKYAENKGYKICGYYGGSHESAKTPGKMVKEMINAVKKNKNIDYIIVSEVDRFSRDGGQCVTIINELFAMNCIVVAAKIGIDSSDKSGRLMLAIQAQLAQWDNNNRTDKFVSGRIACIKNGVWVGHTPLGYRKENKSIHSKYFLNEDGLLIRKAFRWKLDGISNSEIIGRLERLGLPLSKQRLHKILTNPFYCGKIRHKMITDMVDGNQEKAISYIEFLKVQKILSNRTGIYKHKKETPNFPLKRFVKCDEDKTLLTAYSVKKKE